MSKLFDQLAKTEVPPPPSSGDFGRAVHDRVNRNLLPGQLVDFAFGAVPLAAWHLARAIGGWMVLTISGRFPDGPKDVR